MNNIEQLHILKLQVHLDKNLIYKKEKIPVDYELLARSSKYFYDKKESYKNIENIEISEYFEINIESFKQFISCCQNEFIKIDNINVFPLYQLSVIYQVPELKQLTLNYIKSYQKDLIFQTIAFLKKVQNHNYNLDFDLKSEEEFIANDFFQYVDNKEMFSLPIDVLYSILNNYNININNLNSEEQDKMVDFLFKCLDKKGKQASVLFLNLDLKNQRIDLLTKLVHHYKDIFDFNMINSTLNINSIYESMNNLSALKIEYSKKFDELNNQMNIKNQELNDKISDLTDLINSQQKQIKSLEEQLKQKEEQLKQVEKNMNDKFDQQLKQTEKSMNDKFDKQLKQIENKFAGQLKDLKEELPLSYECLNINYIKKLPDNTDLNTQTKIGSYFIQNHPNGKNYPSGISGNAFRLIVKALNQNNIQQHIITCLQDENYTRVYQISTKKWSNWKSH